MQGLRMTDTMFAENALQVKMKQQYHTGIRKTNKILRYIERPLICKTCNNQFFFTFFFPQVKIEQ